MRAFPHGSVIKIGEFGKSHFHLKDGHGGEIGKAYRELLSFGRAGSHSSQSVREARRLSEGRHPVRE